MWAQIASLTTALSGISSATTFFWQTGIVIVSIYALYIVIDLTIKVIKRT